MLILKQSLLCHLKKTTIIPLGEHCMITHHLKRSNLLKKNFGFEWITTTDLKCCTLLFKNNFANLFAFSNLQIQANKNDNRIIIKDTVYNISSHHDVENEQQLVDNPELLQKIYRRRFYRLKKALCAKKKVIFIRYHTGNIVEEELKDFIEVIRLNYPKLEFILVLVLPINIKRARPLIDQIHYVDYQITLRHRVINKFRYYLKSRVFNRHAWQGDYFAWNKIFSQINNLIAPGSYN